MATQLRIAYVSALVVVLAGVAASPLACSSPNTGDDSDGTPPNDASTGDANNPGDSAPPTDSSSPIVDAGVDAPAPACGGGSASIDAAAPSVANAACCYALVSGTPGYSGSFVNPVDSGLFPESTDVTNCCIGMILYEDQTCAGADASDCNAYANVYHCCPLAGDPQVNTCM